MVRSKPVTRKLRSEDALFEIVCHDPQPIRADCSRHSRRRCRRHQQHGQKEGLGDLRPARQTRHRKEREE